jgi:hypothetical protein
VLYVATGLGWGISAAFAVHAAVTESMVTRTATMFVLALTAALSTAALFSVYVAPLEKVYRHGYEAGLRAEEANRVLPRVVGQGAVIPLRPVRFDVRSDC